MARTAVHRGVGGVRITRVQAHSHVGTLALWHFDTSQNAFTVIPILPGFLRSCVTSESIDSIRLTVL